MKRLLIILFVAAVCITIWWGSHVLDGGAMTGRHHVTAPVGEYPKSFVLLDEPEKLPEVGFLLATYEPEKDDHDIQERKLDNYAAGDVVLLNMWATWCGPCVEEMPAFDSLQETYGKQGLKVVPLSQDVSDTPAGIAYAIRDFYGKYELTHLPVAIDKFGEVFSSLDARGLPVTLVIDRKGRVRARIVGLINWESDWFTGWLEGLLAEPK